MKKYCRLIIVLISLFIIFISATSCRERNITNGINEDVKEKVNKIFIATEGVEGNYYLIGAGISIIVTKHVNGVEAICKSTGCSLENLKCVNEGEIDMSFISSGLAHLAYKGQCFFQNQPLKDIRAVAALYPQVVQFIVVKKSGMEKVNDLKNKKVAVGPANSETERIAKILLEAHEITYNDIEPQFLDYSNAISALRDGEIDCAIINSWVPEKIVADASAILDINLLEIDKHAIEELADNIRYFEKETILSRTYNGVDKYILAGATSVLLVTREDMDEDIVYNITKTIFENIDELESIHTLGQEIKSDNPLKDISIPLHRGAERYYKEAGILQ